MPGLKAGLTPRTATAHSQALCTDRAESWAAAAGVHGAPLSVPLWTLRSPQLKSQAAAACILTPTLPTSGVWCTQPRLLLTAQPSGPEPHSFRISESMALSKGARTVHVGPSGVPAQLTPGLIACSRGRPTQYVVPHQPGTGDKAQPGSLPPDLGHCAFVSPFGPGGGRVAQDEAEHRASGRERQEEKGEELLSAGTWLSRQHHMQDEMRHWQGSHQERVFIFYHFNFF